MRLARYAPAVSVPNFKIAARRHYVDAEYLLNDQRWPNADHLAGVAAECGLKAIMEGWLGATLNSSGVLVWGPSNAQLRYHVDRLWNEIPQIIAGRSAPTFVTLISGPPPFATWDVSDRYSDGSAITEQCAREHVDKAKEIIEVLEQAMLNGVVP